MNSSEYIKAINSAFDQCVFVSREAMMHALITIRKIEALTLDSFCSRMQASLVGSLPSLKARPLAGRTISFRIQEDFSSPFFGPILGIRQQKRRANLEYRAVERVNDPVKIPDFEPRWTPSHVDKRCPGAHSAREINVVQGPSPNPRRTPQTQTILIGHGGAPPRTAVVLCSESAPTEGFATV